MLPRDPENRQAGQGQGSVEKGRWERSGVSRSVQDLPFTLDSKEGLRNLLQGGGTCFQTARASAVFDLCVSMCCLCNQEKSHQNPRKPT